MTKWQDTGKEHRKKSEKLLKNTKEESSKAAGLARSLRAGSRR